MIMNEKRNRLRRGPRLVLAAIALLIGLVVYSCSGPSKGTLAWYVDRLTPGMTEADVRALMPTDYFIVARSILPRACEEAKPECRIMRCYVENTPVAWEHLYSDIKSTMGIADASLFFSTNHVLVGWRFSASGAEMPSGRFGSITVQVVRVSAIITNTANNRLQAIGAKARLQPEP